MMDTLKDPKDPKDLHKDSYNVPTHRQTIDPQVSLFGPNHASLTDEQKNEIFQSMLRFKCLD